MGLSEGQKAVFLAPFVFPHLVGWAQEAVATIVMRMISRTVSHLALNEIIGWMVAKVKNFVVFQCPPGLHSPA